MMRLRSSRGGFVLIAALWLLVALGAVGLDAAVRSKARRLPAANLLDESRARQAALAGGEYARARLTAALHARELELRTEIQRRGVNARNAQTQARRMMSLGQADNPWREPMQLVEPDVALGEVRFQLNVYDTGIAVNVNTAAEDMLLQFLTQGIGLDFLTSERLTQSLLDWRDEDTLPRARGGERSEYIDAGAVILPGNRPFADLSELGHVLGITPELLAALLPYVTVIGTGRINVNAAPAEVLAAVPGLTAGDAVRLVRQRDAGMYVTNAGELYALLGKRAPTGRELQELNRRVTFSTNEVAIVSDGYLDGSPVRARATLVVGRASSAVVLWRKIE